MDIEEKDLEQTTSDYKVNVQMVTFVVIIMVVIVTLVYLIKIYSHEKETVIRNMKTEATLLETVISDHLNYSKYFISLIGRNIRTNPNDLEYIKETLQNHFQSQDFNRLFGWRKYSWVSNDFKELVTSTNGIEKTPRNIDFVRDIVNKIRHDEKDKIVFRIIRINKSIQKPDTLKLVDAIFNEKTHKFVGSVILSYDIDTMVKSLNSYKKNHSINFVIIDKNLNIVAKSKPAIDNIICKDNIFAPNLLKQLQKLNLSKIHTSNEFSYLDMIDGVNYFIKPLHNLPFAVVVNIDNHFIKKNIVDSVTGKFLEVGIFAGICLIIIISIYKRETSLRTKAERATILANNATKAKTSFLAFTAHEIRSPLGFISTSSEVMSKELFGPLPPVYVEYVEGIYSNAQRILDFITDILDENQIIEGQFKITNSLNKIENIIMQIVKSHARKKDVSILTDFAPNLPLLVCDKSRMLQVIDNLVSNSIKYSNGTTNIKISVKMEEDRMVIIISDQGIGMKEDDIPIALSKYGTLHSQDYQKGGSYGLGLPIVKMLLDAHDAILDISSADGKGTIVKIIFPKFKIVYKKEKN